MRISFDANTTSAFALGAGSGVAGIYLVNSPAVCSTALKIATVAATIYQAMTFYFVSEIVSTLFGLALAVRIAAPFVYNIFDNVTGRAGSFNVTGRAGSF